MNHSSSTSLVHKRMQDVLIAHESALSNLNLSSLEHRRLILEKTTEEEHQKQQQIRHHRDPNFSTTPTSTNHATPSTTKPPPTLSLAQAALYRTTFTSQPPFQRIQNNYDHHNLIIDLNLNPPERVSPQDLLIHDKRRPSNILLQNSGHHLGSIGLVGIGGYGIDHRHQSREGDEFKNIDISSLTLKTITVLSTLCDEAHELYEIGRYKLIPKIHLFAHDLNHGEFVHDYDNRRGSCGGGDNSTTDDDTNNYSSNNNSSNNNDMSINNDDNSNDRTTMNVLLNEKLLAERDSKLLHRMSKFITSLQSTQNYVLRCHRLIRNIICQIHGCLSPIKLYQHDNSGFHDGIDDYDIDGDEEDVGSKNNLSVPRFIGNPLKKTSKSSTASSKTKANEQQQQPKSTPTLPPMFRQSNHLMMLGEALIKLLSILITLDSIIGQNFELHEAWDLYKSIVTERAEKLEESLAAKVTASASLDGLCGGYDDDSARHKQDDNELNNDDYRTNLISLERMIMQIDFTLLSSRSFLICIEQNFDPRGRFCFNPVTEKNEKSPSRRKTTSSGNSSHKDDKKGIHHQQSKPLYENIKNIVSSLYEWYCSVIHTNEETNERYEIVGIYGLYCLYRRLLPSNKEPDEKLHRALCTVFPTSYPIIPLVGNIPFMPVDFIAKYAPLDTSRMGGRGRTRAPRESEIINSARDILEKFDKSFDKKVRLLYDEAMAWALRAESELAPLERSNDMMLFDDVTNIQTDMILTPSDHQSSYEMKLVKQKSEAILQGLTIASQATILLRTFLFLHTFLRVKIESKKIQSIKQLCYIAKSIEKVLGVRKRDCVVSMNKAVLKILASSLYSCFDKLRSYIDQRSVDHGREALDQIHVSTISTSLWALESILKGTSTFSPSRRYAMEVAVYICSQESFNCITNEDKKSIRNLLNQIKWLSDIDDKLHQVCDCSFLYYYKDSYPMVIKSLYTDSEYDEVEQIQLMMSALSDAVKLLQSSSYFHASFYKERYCEFVIDRVFNQEFLQPLAFKIEASLRLLLFAKNLSEIKPVNPKEQLFGRFKKYIEMQPIKFCGITIHVKKAVERYLEKSFYNFATVGLNDSKTYSEMAIFGNEIYGLNLNENNLPKENIQVVDFADILDIRAFVEKYNYNMVQQNFIERKVNNGCKYLKTLGIETISSSFQRHGLGIATTYISLVKTSLYEIFDSLGKIFSDNLLKSFLSKESRWFKQISSTQNANYPHDRAMTFRKEITKIGSNDEDSVTLPFLEQCRELVTLIGNILGLARLVQSGKMYAINQSKKQSSSFSYGRFEKERSILDEVSNQFKSELKVTSSKLHNTSELLQNFYILFPALSLSWLDTSIRGKDMLSKKYQTFDAYYTDDGFAMGSAFLLEVLDQSSPMDNLHWFESSCVAFATDRKKILQNLKQKSLNSSEGSKREKTTLFGSKAKEESKQIIEHREDELSRLRVTAKRLEIRKQEMELLHYTVLGARVFFSSS